MGSAAYLALKAKERLNFFDEFNRGAVDTDFWDETLDGGGTLAAVGEADRPTHWTLTTGNVIDNDSGITGNAIKNKYFTPYEVGYTTVTFETHIRLISVADISVLIGLFQTVPTSYAEPATDCVQFLMDPAISATFRARTYDAVEEETDTLIALDTNYHKLKIIWTRTSATFYIDDVEVASHVTRVPDSATRLAFLIRTEAAGAKWLQIDYVHVEVT